MAANNLAQYYADRGEQLDTALQLAQTAKAALPNRPEIDDTLGWVYYKRNVPVLAIASFKQCVAARPDNPSFLAHLGLAYAQNKDREPARQALKKALAMKADFDGAADARATLAQLGG
jgi:Flp pilus assembly protein TadD